MNVCVGLMLGTLYWQAGIDGSKVLDNYNLLFSILMHHMMSTMMLTILTCEFFNSGILFALLIVRFSSIGDEHFDQGALQQMVHTENVLHGSYVS